MSTNSSFDSLRQPLPGPSILYSASIYCYFSKPDSYIFLAFYIIHAILLLPLSIFILFSALKSWKEKRSSGLVTSLSHFECFTYHVSIMEGFCTVRLIPYFMGIYAKKESEIYIGGLFSSFIWYGQTCFHLLTCGERYLAVVHPITYMSLRTERGLKIRNCCLGFVWLFCFARMSLFDMKDVILIMDFCFLGLSFLIILGCNLLILYVLMCPAPGAHGGVRVDQMKKRAFYTLLTILGVVVLRCSGSLIWIVFSEKKGYCLVKACMVWCNVPSSLVMPLMFVNRSGRFKCFKNTFH